MPASSMSHVPALPVMGVFTLLRALLKLPKRRPRRALPSALPDIVTEYRLDRLPLDEIARYRSAFGFSGDHVPLTWWYLLAQRAHLATMLQPAFPFRIVGLVHMENMLEEHGSVAAGQALLLRTVLRVLPPSSSGALRCALETTGRADGAPVFTCTSTYLIRRGDRGGAKQPDSVPDLSEAPLAQWTLDAAAGRRYARLSGDWNPIHLTGWSARLMGMRAPIIHGMHTLATVCAALEKTHRRVSRLECRFKKPIPLGQTLSLSWSELNAQFAVVVNHQLALAGHCALS